MIRRPFGLSPDAHTRLLGEALVPEGPPPRSAVLLVHGFRAFKDWAFFPWLAEELASHGHLVARFSFSGSGVGPTGDEFTDLDSFERNTLSREIGEVERVLDAFDNGNVFPRPPRRIAVVGHGRGGGVAMIAASESDRVSKLVTLSAVQRFDRWKPDTVAEWRANGRHHVLDQRSGRQLPVGLGLLEDFERNRERFDLMRVAATLEVPWLVVHGLDDLTVPPDDARALARAGKNTRLLLLADAGHAFGVRHPMGSPTPALTRLAEEVLAHLGAAD